MGFGFILIPIIIFGVIAASIAKEAKAQKKKQEAEDAIKKFDEKVVQKRQSETTLADIGSTIRENDALSKRVAAMEAIERQSSATYSASGKRPPDATRAARVSQGHHQSHCDVSSHESKDRYKVEYVPVMNSIGGKSTEGCEDHYNVRFVKLDSDESAPTELTDLQKAIVYGEVLNNPAFRCRRGIRR